MTLLLVVQRRAKFTALVVLGAYGVLSSCGGSSEDIVIRDVARADTPEASAPNLMPGPRTQQPAVKDGSEPGPATPSEEPASPANPRPSEGQGNSGTGNGQAGTGQTGAGGSGNGQTGNGQTGEGNGNTNPPGSGSTEPVVVEIGTCEALAPCGGDLEGTWSYTASCVDADALGLTSQVAAVCADATIENLTGEVSGTLTFQNGLATRTGASIARGTLVLPTTCPGVPAALLLGCSVLEGLLTSEAPFNAVDCAPAAGACRCALEVRTQPYQDQPAQVSGSQVTIGTDLTFAFCQQGDQLVYEGAQASSEPGRFTLERVR
jgi:hypothetical protein